MSKVRTTCVVDGGTFDGTPSGKQRHEASNQHRTAAAVNLGQAGELKAGFEDAGTIPEATTTFRNGAALPEDKDEVATDAGQAALAAAAMAAKKGQLPLAQATGLDPVETRKSSKKDIARSTPQPALPTDTAPAAAEMAGPKNRESYRAPKTIVGLPITPDQIAAEAKEKGADGTFTVVRVKVQAADEAAAQAAARALFPLHNHSEYTAIQVRSAHGGAGFMVRLLLRKA